MLEQPGKALDDSLEKFKRMKLQYPTNPRVVQFLDFVDLQVQAGVGCQSNQSPGSKPDSASSVGGIESLQNKVIKTKKILIKNC